MHLLQGLLCLCETGVHSALVFEVPSALSQAPVLVPKSNYFPLKVLKLLTGQPLSLCNVLD